MKKILSIIFMAFIGIAAAFAQTSDIQDTFFGVRFGTSQEAAESILMRKDIYAVSDYNQLDFYNVHLGGYEWRHCSMLFNSFGFYSVSLEYNFNSRDGALSMFNGLFLALSKKYGAFSSSDIDSFNDKNYMFMDDERMCVLSFMSKGGDMFYYVMLGYQDMNLYGKTNDEL